MLIKSPENFSLAGSSNYPFGVFLSARGPKIAQPWRKISGGQDTHYISVSAKSEASI